MKPLEAAVTAVQVNPVTLVNLRKVIISAPITTHRMR